MESKKDLWLRIRNYQFNDLVPPHLMDHVTAMFGRTDASTKAFASKLARKLGWTNAFALRAIEEYRKFVYLGMVSDFAVTPPRVIDQVWHEHLLFSRAYREFCASVLHRDFDHNPELVPTDAQTGTFSAQYEATLNLYALEFNVEPPHDIWGKPKFAYALVPKGRKKPRKKDSADSGYDDSSSGGDAPLFTLFDGSDTYGSADSMSEFGGGGGFSGGGGESSWGDSADSSSDSGSGGDSGGSDGGGSGCSSGCGGGCSS